MSGGGSKTQTVGYRYYMGLHFGVCMGPVDSLREIRVGDRTAWIGDQTTSGSISINSPNLFGGEEKEGGVSGTMDVMMGEATQSPNAYLTSVQGAAQPAYRGFLGLVFRQGYISANNPYVKPFAMRVKRILSGWKGGSAWYPEKSTIQIPGEERLLIADTATAATTICSGSNPNIIVVSGFNANDALIIRHKGASGVYGGVSLWNDDYATFPGTPDPAGTWTNAFFVTKADGSTTSYWGGWYRTEAQCRAAGEGLVATVTGSTSYSLWVGDPNPPDNRGGFSVEVSVAPVTDSMNPAHIIYECLTNADWGMGYPASQIDDANFRAAADTFFAEGMGLCLKWTRQNSIEAFCQIVMDHAGAVLTQDPSTGLFILKLIRGGYDANTLPQYDETNVVALDNFQRPAMVDTVNEITVVYTEGSTGKEAVVTVQNLAQITSQGGVVTSRKSYPGIPGVSLASRVALRDLYAISTPLAKVRLRVNRKGYTLLPGDLIRLSWAKLGVVNMVLRVLAVSGGTLNNGEIVIDAAEDAFGLPATTYIGQQAAGWKEPSSLPAVTTKRIVQEAPYWDVIRNMSAADQTTIAGDEGYLQVVAGKPTSDTQSFKLMTKATGASSFTQAGTGDYCPTGTLAATIGEAATSMTVTGLMDGELIAAETYAIIDSEIVRIDAINLTTGVVTIGRGVLDTVAKPHTAGATVYFASGFLNGDNVERLDGETLQVELLTTTGAGTIAESLVPTDSVTFARRMNRPYPPGRLRINSLAYPAQIIDQPLTISWASRNRLTQNLQGDETGGLTSEAGVTYTLQIFNATTNALLQSYTGIAATTASQALSYISGTLNLRVELWSVRGGLASRQKHAYTFEYINITRLSTEGLDRLVAENLDSLTTE